MNDCVNAGGAANGISSSSCPCRIASSSCERCTHWLTVWLPLSSTTIAYSSVTMLVLLSVCRPGVSQTSCALAHLAGPHAVGRECPVHIRMAHLPCQVGDRDAGAEAEVREGV